MGWNFSYNSNSFPICKVDTDNIRSYKRKLKNLIKASSDLSILNTLKSVNREIVKWINIYSLSDSWEQTSFDLDIFLYKTFWRSVKRYHPRRPSTWIYNKYWKFFSGTWRFVVFDSERERNYFLKSHSRSLFDDTRVYTVPSSLNVFSLYNQKKLLSILFKKTRNIFLGTSRRLYLKQKGLCFICVRPFFFNNFRIINYSSLLYTTKLNVKLILVHSYCI